MVLARSIGEKLSVMPAAAMDTFWFPQERRQTEERRKMTYKTREEEVDNWDNWGRSLN